LAAPDISGKMAGVRTPSPEEIVNLSKTLQDIRKMRGHSLRQVEEGTGISNAYLSQLERGDASKPSPDKLQALAEFYQVPYTDLMREAGYLEKAGESGRAPESTGAIQAALMSTKLTPEEEEAVVKYIQFLRFQNKK
jgi:HTH-type transcriptional regulator, competence development regulator